MFTEPCTNIEKLDAREMLLINSTPETKISPAVMLMDKHHFHFIFNSLYMVAPQISGSVLQGAVLKTLHLTSRRRILMYYGTERNEIAYTKS